MTRQRALNLTGFLTILAYPAVVTGLDKGDDSRTRPNVLWITSEDNGAQWLGCYGNADAHTPRIDQFARDSLLFAHAYSNAAVCAVARSTLLNGAYAVSQGTQHMRSRYPIPPQFRPYVAYLRDNGYYCTNNSKTDYNFQGDDKSIWDACSNQAHYKNRDAGKPFFAVFNLTVSHESSLFPENVSRNRRRSIIPAAPRLAPNAVALPPYLPDLPEIRRDFAIYHDTVTALDAQVGQLLDELEQHGLTDDTIVFYFADHGGPTPRGKRYLEETGVRVPLIIRVPPKGRRESPWEAGQKVTEMVAFVDFAPTLLSLCGIDVPPPMQGRAFLGTQRVEPPSDALTFLYADRFDEIVGMRRGITDGRFKYIRCFTPHLPAAPYSYYSLAMPCWQAWQNAWKEGQLEGRYRSLWQVNQPVESLFDTQVDPWEVANLADAPEHAERLSQMRRRLRDVMAKTRDTSLVPEALVGAINKECTLHEYVRSDRFDLERTLDLAFAASARRAENLPQLQAALGSDDPVQRYWGALGCVILGPAADSAKTQLVASLDDSTPTVRIMAARALCATRREHEGRLGKEALLAHLDVELDDETALLLVNLITQVGALDDVPQRWIDRILDDSHANEYLRRFADRCKK